MIRKLFLATTLLCTVGCASFDPLHLLPKPDGQPDKPVVIDSDWEKQAPDKTLFADTYKIWSELDPKPKAEDLRSYYGLLDALSDETSSGSITTGADLETVLKQAGPKLNLVVGAYPTFSAKVVDLLDANAPNKNTKLEGENKQKIADGFKSISCGTAAAYSKLFPGGAK